MIQNDNMTKLVMKCPGCCATKSVAEFMNDLDYSNPLCDDCFELSDIYEYKYKLTSAYINASFIKAYLHKDLQIGRLIHQRYKMYDDKRARQDYVIYLDNSRKNYYDALFLLETDEGYLPIRIYDISTSSSIAVAMMSVHKEEEENEQLTEQKIVNMVCKNKKDQVKLLLKKKCY